jgi:hypothetical protein
MTNKDNVGTAHTDFITIHFEADTLASERYQSVFQSPQVSPEKQLMMAVLDDAVQSFLAGIKARNTKALRQFEEARMWITEMDSHWIFSFDSICNLLGLDPDYLRSGLQKLKAETRAEQRSRPPTGNRFPHTGTASGRSILRIKSTAGSRKASSPSYEPSA